ncbi:alanine racemase [Psychrosphaera algicola]|uniref:Alanine racemase n=1 Tax=Psychrosphaera algicola TaxID=3023714 RepID=A0ABT5FG22_9GAMM|nr:alanine racemase [Psychrosphaera sp. G1-22]MDC2889552.1 alanine racemase [Psychrosphaera sp. G1-22]
MYQPTADINLSALNHNLTQIKKRVKHANVLAMVKADGYGHGIVPVAQSLAAANAFGVARASEAKELVDAQINKPVVLVEGCFDLDEYQWALQSGVQVAIHTPVQLEQFLSLKTSKRITVWLKLDTGMHRLGFSPTQFKTAFQQLEQCQHCVDIISMTHFACADDLENPLNEMQLSEFEQTCSGLEGQQSVANSALILSRPDKIKDWVRPGIALYGSSPIEGSQSQDFDLRPVMTFKANIIAINAIPKGHTVGYGCGWTADKDSTIAVVAVGYGDGYPRHAQNGTPVLINDQKAPLVGRVSMDMITVDISELTNVNIGDSVVLWGEGLPAEEIAICASTISYTLFCGITRRVKRNYIRA